MALRLALLLALLLALPALEAEEEAPPPFRLPHSFQVEGLSLRVVGAEVTPDRRNFLAHVEVEELRGQEARIDWQDWFAAVTRDGTKLRPPTDVGVDDGSGLRRCFGSQPIRPGKRLRLLIYWPLYPHEVPIRLWIRGGALSADAYD